MLYCAAADPGASPAAQASWPGTLDLTRVSPSLWAAAGGGAADTIGSVHDRLCQGIYDESTRDYSSLLAIPGSIALLRWMGPPAVRR